MTLTFIAGKLNLSFNVDKFWISIASSFVHFIYFLFLSIVNIFIHCKYFHIL